MSSKLGLWLTSCMTMAAIGRGKNEKPGMLHLVVTLKHSLLANLGLAGCMLCQTVLA